MSAEERDLLAAECPMPSTLAKARKLASMFRRQCIFFAYDTDQHFPDLYGSGEIHEIFKRRWSTASIFQREAILTEWAIEILTGASK